MTLDHASTNGSFPDGAPVIFIEFNELSPVVVDDLIADGHLPGFEKFRSESSCYTTYTDEREYDLEPWIQWVTLHTGVPKDVHGVSKLGDNKDLKVPTVGQQLHDSGVKVGIYSSMNLRHELDSGYCVPDPWDPNGVTTPRELQPLYDLISAQVQESSKSQLPSLGEMFRLLASLISHGVSISTVGAAGMQLAQELIHKNRDWKRATILDRINYDISKHLHRKHKPQFATFFSNSTAHYQHYFWQNFEPELFSDRDDIDVKSSNAVLFGYKNMDRMLTRFMSDFPDAILVLCTALSQVAWTDTRKQTYRPRSFSDLPDFCRNRCG